MKPKPNRANASARRPPHPYLPTAEEIADRCERTRDRWPDLELRRRAGAAGREPWTPPIVNVDEISTLSDDD